MLKAENLTKIFRSGSEEVVVLDNLSVEVQPGEFVALVGPSGGGKTTLVSLVPRFYDVSEGAIFIDGAFGHIRSSGRRAWRRRGTANEGCASNCASAGSLRDLCISTHHGACTDSGIEPLYCKTVADFGHPICPTDERWTGKGRLVPVN